MARSRKSRNQAGVNQVFAFYKYECYRRNKFWGLSLEEFSELIKLPCVYCRKPPANNCNGFKYQGIDRKDNSKGYHRLNAVAACGVCNSIKGQHLSHEEMLAAMRAVTRLRGKP